MTTALDSCWLLILGAVQMAGFILVYRYVFGGAIQPDGIRFVDYLTPGFVITGVLFAAIGAAVAVAEDLQHGFIDRLRSLPIPRSAVRALTLGSDADPLLGHPTSYFVTRTLLWAFAILAVCLLLTVVRYRRG